MTTPNTAQNVAQNVAIVTGGSTGIGWEICRQMLDAGYEVVSLARRKPVQSHARLHAVEVDLMDTSATGRLPPKGAVIIAAPLKIKQGSGSPLRVLALVADGVK